MCAELRQAASFVAAAIISLTAAAGVAIAHGGADHHNSAPPVIDDGRPWLSGNSLGVNQLSEHRLTVHNLCQSEGERQLERLSSVAVVEEAFVFVPELCLWLEIGEHETEKSVAVNPHLVSKIAEKYHEIVLYHIHPGEKVESIGYFPAFSDLASIFLINASFFDNPEIQIRHRAISSISVIEYSLLLSDELAHKIQRLKETGLKNAISENLLINYSTQDRRTNYIDAVDRCLSRTAADKTTLADCFPMTSSPFRLEYRWIDETDPAVSADTVENRSPID